MKAQHEKITDIWPSEVATILGLNPWQTPIELWMQKTGRAERPDLSDNERVQMGNELEELIARIFAEREEVKIRRVNETLVHPEHEWFRGRIDRQVLGLGHRALLECKNASEYQRDRWGPSGTDEFPEFYEVQVRAYLSLGLGFDEGYLAALIGGNTHRRYRVIRDPSIENMILAEISDFRDRVVREIHPAPINSHDMEILYPDAVSDLVEASDDVLRDFSRLVEIRGALKELGDAKKEIEERVKMCIGEHEGLRDPEGRCLATWKATRSNRFDQSRFRKEHPDLFSQYQTETSSRRFLVK